MSTHALVITYKNKHPLSVDTGNKTLVVSVVYKQLNCNKVSVCDPKPLCKVFVGVGTCHLVGDTACKKSFLTSDECTSWPLMYFRVDPVKHMHGQRGQSSQKSVSWPLASVCSQA